MHIKRFTAANMTDALALVKEALGDDAVILANRRVEDEQGKNLIEVTAATDTPLQTSHATEGYVEEQKSRLESHKKFEKIPENFPEMARDASDLQKLLDKHGILPNISKRIDNAVKALAETGFDDLDTLDMVLGKMITFEAPAKTVKKGRFHVFVGPTGAGKSTTICKLAAQKKIDRHTIALVTLDNQKIGGFEQMAIFASALKEEAHLMKTSKDWENIQKKLVGKDYIFIDTPGINVFNTDQVNSLKKRLETIGLQNASVHLVLPASLNPLEMAAMPAALAALHPESILFTKFDETTYLGGLTNVAITSGLKVCYVTDGTTVPDDIVELDASMLAEKLMRKPRLPWEREV
jgi:flagellar biosynthesis protein FlhF